MTVAWVQQDRKGAGLQIQQFFLEGSSRGVYHSGMKRICIIFGLMLIVAGCQQAKIADKGVSPKGLLIASDDLDSAWDEIIDVLREHSFIPDRQDMRAGIIVTSPTVSKQWFEFWRDDAQGAYQWAESSMHTIRRIVTVRFTPVKDKKIRIDVSVKVQRKCLPQRQITSSSGVIRAFRENIPTYTGETPKTSKVVSWVNLGGDKKLSCYLLKRIHQRLPQAEVITK